MIDPGCDLLKAIWTAADVVDCRYNEMADEEVWGSVSILLANLVENLRTHMCTHPICLEVFKEGQDLSISKESKCQHIFHSECLQLWLKKHDACPCCRVTFIDESTLLEDDEWTEESVGSIRGDVENV